MPWIFRAGPFEGVIIVTEFRIRVGGVCPDECGVQKFRTDAFVPYGVCGTPTGVVFVIHGFVHHIPFGDLSLPVADNAVNVILKHAEELFLLSAVVAYPAGNLAVPVECMATNA